MATFQAGYNTSIYTGKYNLGAYFNSADVERTVAELENTTFGQTAKSRQPGLQDGTAKLAGFFSADVGGVRDAFDAVLGSAAGEPTTLALFGDALVGNPACVWLNRWMKGGAKSAVGGLVATDAEFTAAAGGIAYGTILHPFQAETASGTGTGVDNTVASTVTGYRAALHVVTVTGTTPNLVVKVQDSADNSAWADLVTLTANTTASSQYLASAAGATVRRYVRALWTITGTTPSFQFLLSFARAN